MKKKIEEIPEEEVKKSKKEEREEKAEKRKSAKKQDKMARWSGMILFVILLIVGFLMWVSGEVGSEPTVRSPRQGEQVEQRVVPSSQGSRVVIE